MAKIIDLTNQRFGKLVVLRRNNSKDYKWVCKCDCGQECIIRRVHLKNGHTKSCGCLLKEKLSISKRLEFPWLTSRNDLISSYKIRAKGKGLSFELSREECHKLFKGNCYYCGSPPENTINSYLTQSGDFVHNKHILGDPKLSTYIYNGIDRSDNKMGYYIENCNSCCSICNYGKWNMPLSEWKSWIAIITNFKPNNKKIEKIEIPQISEAQLINKNSVISCYKQSAKRRGLIFELTDTECCIFFKNNCEYCGASPSSKKNVYLLKNGLPSTLPRPKFDPNIATFIFSGIDRIDSSCGYTANQCVSCCKICNRAKSDLPMDKWMEYIERIAKFNAEISFRGMNLLLNSCLVPGQTEAPIPTP